VAAIVRRIIAVNQMRANPHFEEVKVSLHIAQITACLVTPVQLFAIPRQLASA